MVTIGYAAALEQFDPSELLDYSILAEQHGFGGVMAADHFQPWVPQQGHSAFVWSWMAALGARTERMTFGPGVTCPSFRYHPAIVAQAAATQAAMTPGRFWLGLGSGEALNEHVFGGYWPEPHIRLQMMQEAIGIIKKLFSGKVARHDDGKYFKMERVKLWTLPERPVPILVATAGPITAEWTGQQCDGIITPGAGLDKLRMLLGKFADGARKAGKDPATMPKMLQLHMSWAETAEEALHNALTEWPNGGMPFPKQDIRSPEDFAEIAKLVRPENYKNRMLISADLEEHRRYIQQFIDLGFDEIHVHNVGRNQEQFIRVFGEQIIPQLRPATF
ncbi:MAG TPA: TIGR03557 family F420-dependent LLM class oxidoreductase [Roseiflexaceae bacterium]|nr:TIGR03557 family F420-dependent LLM class oxidoreductase [Roseiflexaceae bacterium]HMP39658.1 TIGR03557 family F420-dependent LLM class oxidoreductase [Roseiflexaceae bacterium]